MQTQADTHMDSDSEGATGAAEKKRAVGYTSHHYVNTVLTFQV